jgi:hypothetical protein
MSSKSKSPSSSPSTRLLDLGDDPVELWEDRALSRVAEEQRKTSGKRVAALR